MKIIVARSHELGRHTFSSDQRSRSALSGSVKDTDSSFSATETESSLELRCNSLRPAKRLDGQDNDVKFYIYPGRSRAPT